MVLVVTPAPGTEAYAVEEQLPAGLSARIVSNDGRYDRFLNKLKWGPFFDDQPRTLSFELIIEADAQVTFSGSVSVDGSPARVATGDTSGIVPANGFYSWILAELGQAAPFSAASSPSNDSDRDQTGLLEEYVFGMDPQAADKPVFDLKFDPATDEVGLTMRLRKKPGRVKVGFRESQNLANWSAFDPGEATVLEELEDGIQKVRYVWKRADQGFVRLRLALDEIDQ